MQTPTFRDLGVSHRIAHSLQKRGIESPFPIQALVMQDALAGRDVLAQAPTGSGKTLAFAIPIVERLDPEAHRPAALVLAPTRELAVQITEEFELLLRDTKLKVAAVYGGTKLHSQAEKARRAHIVVATPGRLNDLVQRRMLEIDQIRMLVLDEADRMLDMGFQPQVDRIVAQLPKDRHTMFFSATLDGKVGRVASKYTNEPAQHDVARPAIESGVGIEHRFIPVNRGTKIGTLIELIGEQTDGLTLVFVRTKRGADELVRDLAREGVKVDAMHGDMTQAVRENTLKRFEEGTINTLIATDVAARGLDLDDITRVVQFDPPDDKTGYTHRVGRTGRAGRTGLAITLVQDDQQYVVGRIAVALMLEEPYTAVGLKIYPPRMAYVSKNRGRLGAPPRGRSRR